MMTNRIPRTSSGLLLLLAFVLVAAGIVTTPTESVSAAGNTYFFSTAGTYNASGESEDEASSSFAKALSLMVDGNTILFKRGEKWDIPLQTLDLRGKNNVKISSYPDDNNIAKPIISSLALLGSGGWTADGSGTNRWKLPLNASYTDLFRVFVDNVPFVDVRNQPTPDPTDNPKTPIGSAATPLLVDSPNEFLFKDGVLYVYFTATPYNVHVLPATAAHATGIPLVQMENSNHVKISNIELRGGSRYSIINVEAPSSDVRIDDNTIGWSGTEAAGVVVLNYEGKNGTTPNTDYVSNIYIRGNVIDKIFTDAENNTVLTTGGSNGITLANGVDGGLIQGNIVKNWGHSGIELTSDSAAQGIHGVKHIIVENNNVSGGESGYMHAIDVVGYPGLTTHNIVRRNYMSSLTAMMHWAGSNNYFYSNIVNQVTGTELREIGHSYAPHGVDLIPSMTDKGMQEARDNWIVNNTFANIAGSSLWIDDWETILGNATSNPDVTNIQVVNNIMYNYGPDDIPGHVPYGLRIGVGAGGVVKVRNNNFWDPDATSPSTAVVSDFKTQPYNAAGLNGATGCGAYCTNNTQLEPHFFGGNGAIVNPFELTAASDSSLKYGGADLRNYLPADFGDFLDFNGNSWKFDEPGKGASRGAIQYGN